MTKKKADKASMHLNFTAARQIILNNVASLGLEFNVKPTSNLTMFKKSDPKILVIKIKLILLKLLKLLKFKKKEALCYSCG